MKSIIWSFLRLSSRAIIFLSRLVNKKVSVENAHVGDKFISSARAA